MRTVGRQGLRRPSAMGGVCNVFRPGAAAHGWRALPFPLAPFRSHTGSGRGGHGGWRESMVAHARNGRICTVRALCNIRVFDQALTPFQAPTWGAEGETECSWRKGTWVLPYEMVARVRDVPNDKAGFLIRLVMCCWVPRWYADHTRQRMPATPHADVERVAIPSRHPSPNADIQPALSGDCGSGEVLAADTSGSLVSQYDGIVRSSTVTRS